MDFGISLKNSFIELILTEKWKKINFDLVFSLQFNSTCKNLMNDTKRLKVFSM